MPAAHANADTIQVTVSSVEVCCLTAVGTVPGVAIRLAAGRNGPGQGRLRTNTAGDALAWQAPGSETWGEWVTVADGQEYVLEDGEDAGCYLRVEVFADYLVAGAESVVSLADRYLATVAGDDLTAAEAAAGNVATWTLTLTNAGSLAVTDLLAWLDAAVTGLELSANGSDWSAPTSAATAVNLGDLASSASATLHVRRTITAGASADPSVLARIELRFDTEGVA